MTRAGATVQTLFYVLVGAHALTALAGIALLERMSPAIEQILTDNERSIHAAERMLGALNTSPASDEARAELEAALRAAENNVTEAREGEVIARIRARSGAALDGDPAARRRVIADLLRLSAINRNAMRRADASAQRLALAGRWALALLGVIGILGSAWAFYRARRNVVAPMVELASVLEARRRGDRHRRYLHEQEGELAPALAGINALLDAADAEPADSSPREARALRSALVRLLDLRGGALLVADRDGSVLATSREALAIMGEHGDRIRAALRDGTVDAWAEDVEPLEPASLLLLTLRASPPPMEG